MHCEQVRGLFEKEGDEPLSPSAREHLSSCAECAEWRRGRLILRAGWEVLAREPAPEPMLGFRERLLRRLEEASHSRQAAEFLERAGRRVVWATLALALTFLLALVLPSQGPVRSAETAELYLLEAEPPTPTESLLSVTGLEVSTVNQARGPQGVENTRK
jgi:hypothetical protein